MVLSVFLIFFLAFFLFWEIYIFFWGSSFITTPKRKIQKALALLDLKEGQIFYDLGAGDGRVLIFAAQKYKTKSKGIEINPLLVKLIRIKIKMAGVQNLVKIEKGNFFKKNLSDADALFVYLNQKITDKLEKKLLKELKKGTKIVLCPSFFKKIPLIKKDEEFPDLKLYQIL